jgi:hypothetical protein
MPLVLQPIQEIKQASEPFIEKVENSTIDAVGGFWVLLLFLVLYLFKKPILGLFFFLLKILILISFAYLTYILV